MQRGKQRASGALAAKLRRDDDEAGTLAAVLRESDGGELAANHRDGNRRFSA